MQFWAVAMLDTLLSRDREPDVRDIHIERRREWYAKAPMGACVDFSTWAFLQFPWATHGVGINNRFRGAVFSKRYCTSYRNDAKLITILNDYDVCNSGGNITEWSMAGKQKLLQEYLDKHGGIVAATRHAFDQCMKILATDFANKEKDQTAGEVGAAAAPAGRSEPEPEPRAGWRSPPRLAEVFHR